MSTVNFTKKRTVDFSAESSDNVIMRIDVKTNKELYELIAKESDRQNVAMGKLLAGLAAAYFKRPELNYIPEKRRGRPRKYARAS